MSYNRTLADRVLKDIPARRALGKRRYLELKRIFPLANSFRVDEVAGELVFIPRPRPSIYEYELNALVVCLGATGVLSKQIFIPHINSYRPVLIVQGVSFAE